MTKFSNTCHKSRERISNLQNDFKITRMNRSLFSGLRSCHTSGISIQLMKKQKIKNKSPSNIHILFGRFPKQTDVYFNLLSIFLTESKNVKTENTNHFTCSCLSQSCQIDHSLVYWCSVVLKLKQHLLAAKIIRSALRYTYVKLRRQFILRGNTQ